MRNDDYEAVEDLERGLRAAEREIAELERENKALKSSNANLITELQSLQCPTFMGEPVINTDREDARRYRWLRDVSYHASAVPNGEMVWCVTGEGCGKVEPIHGKDLDDAIDATILYHDAPDCCEHGVTSPTGCDECYDKASDNFSIVRAMEKL